MERLHGWIQQASTKHSDLLCAGGAEHASHSLMVSTDTAANKPHSHSQINTSGSSSYHDQPLLLLCHEHHVMYLVTIAGQRGKARSTASDCIMLVAIQRRIQATAYSTEATSQAQAQQGPIHQATLLKPSRSTTAAHAQSPLGASQQMHLPERHDQHVEARTAQAQSPTHTGYSAWLQGQEKDSGNACKQQVL